jgi:hypothetical protein
MPFLHQAVVGKARPIERDDMASLHIVWVLQKEKGMPELVNQGYKMKNYIISLPEFDNRLEHNYVISQLVAQP